MGLCNVLLHNARIGYENTYDMRAVFICKSELEKNCSDKTERHKRASILSLGFKTWVHFWVYFSSFLFASLNLKKSAATKAEPSSCLCTRLRCNLCQDFTSILNFSCTSLQLEYRQTQTQLYKAKCIRFLR